MYAKRTTLAIVLVIALLSAFGASQLLAQSSITLEGLAARIDSLTKAVATLNKTKADRSETQSLERRLATVEAQLNELSPATHTPTPIPTWTRIPGQTPRPTFTLTPVPSSTPTLTQVPPTHTLEPATPYVTINRRMNVRRGPGTHHSIVGLAEVNDIYDITGKNINGDWWRIDFNGQHGWLYAPYVAAKNADRTQVVPTPTSVASPTPRPTATSQASQEQEYTATQFAYAISVLDRSRRDLKQEWDRMSESDRARIVAATEFLLVATSEQCGLSVEEMAIMINHYGLVLDDAGYTTRNDIRARAVLLLVLADSENVAFSKDTCNHWLDNVVNGLLDS